MSKLQKFPRLIMLVNLLQSGERYLTASKLANRLGVNERTIYRDLQSLPDLGVQVSNDCGYRVERGNLPVTIQPDAEDIQLIQELINSSPLSQLQPHQEDCRKLLMKLECLIPEPSEEETTINYLEPLICDRLEFSTPDLERACNEHRVCAMNYQALDETEPSLRTIHPYRIVIRSAQWYLIALDAAKRELRLYHYLRIKGMQVMKHTFERDPTLDLTRFFEDSWNVFHGPKHRVRLRVRGVAARLISERTSPRELNIAWTSQDEAVVIAEVCGEQEIINWTLSMGSNAEILEPQDLREKVSRILSASLRLYEQVESQA